MLESVKVEPQGSADACVIWLHGLGDSGDGFAPIVPVLQLPANHKVRFIFPHAPVQPVTLNQGQRMRSWYDIKSMDPANRADEAGVIESVAAVDQLIEAQIAAGIAPERIVLAGFSQGGVVSLHLATRAKHQFAGVMALSTYMCQPAKLAYEHTGKNQSTPILMHHGKFDDVVPMSAATTARDHLTELNYQVEWQTFDMAHSVCEPQIQQISRWLVKQLSL